MNNDQNFHYLFLGKPGTGKTYLANIIKKSIPGCKFMEAREIYSDYLRIIGGNFSDKAEAIAKREHSLRGEYVIMDDLGDEKGTEAGHEFIGKLITDRYYWFKKGFAKGTIITSNLDGKAIKEIYGSRIIDRLYEMCIVMEFQDHSFRMDNLRIISG